MASCHEMKLDQVWRCGDCGVELRVTKQCNDCEETQGQEGGCTCEVDCSIECCGKPLQLVS
jgi:hypothetical protein